LALSVPFFDFWICVLIWDVELLIRLLTFDVFIEGEVLKVDEAGLFVVWAGV